MSERRGGFAGTGSAALAWVRAGALILALVCAARIGLDARAHGLERALWRAGEGPTFSLLVALSAAGAVLAALELRRALRERRAAVTAGQPARARLGRVAWTALALAAGATPLVLSARAAPRRALLETVREVATDGSWSVVAAHPAHAPRAGVLTPTLEYDVDGGDLPSIVMPPPCTVRFAVEAADGPVALRLAAGVDRGWHPRSFPALLRARLVFEVLVNDAPLAREEIEPVYTGVEGHRRWRRLGGAAGFALEPGDVVTLRTSVTGADVAPEDLPLIEAGFGDVVLERRVERELQRATPSAPNVLLIVVDTLRADRLSCYGCDDYRAPTTPRLDELAARGTLFEQAYSTSSWTWPSTASILTGSWPEAHGVVADGSCWLASENVTLAEALAAQGCVTAAFSCNPLIVADKNFDQGFEHFDEPQGASFRPTRRVLPAVEAWLDEHADARFFLYLHLVDTHFPYDPLPRAMELAGCPELACAPDDYPSDGVAEYQALLLAGEGRASDGSLDLERVVPSEHQRYLTLSYDMAVCSMDELLGRLLARLEALGLAERTLVAFTSDHGEELLDHGGATHGHALWEELVRVPLILAGPGVRSGTRVGTPVSNRHLAPTLARLAGAPFPPPAEGLHLDQLAPGRGEPASERPVFVSTQHGWWNGRQRLAIYGVRQGDRMLHFAPQGLPWQPAPDGAPGEARLFDLARDAEQREDRAAHEAALTSALRATLEEHLERAEAARPKVTLGAGGSTLRMLREIGYTGDETR